MRIRTKLNVGAALSLVIFLAIGVSLYAISKLVNNSVERGAIAVRVVENLTELRWVAFDYVLYGEDLAHTQWDLKYQSFEEYLASVRPQWTGESLVIVDRIMKEHRELKIIVDQFKRPNLNPEYRKRLSGQLAVKTQSMITDASTLDEASRKEISETRRISFLLIMVLVTLVTGVMGLNSWLLYRSITRSLAKVQRGTELVAAGNLHQLIGLRGKDEISAVATAFDEMTLRLRQSYTHLEEEIAERKYAEDSLRRERDLISRILATSPVGIMRVTVAGDIVFANVRAQEVLGITQTEDAAHLYNVPTWPMYDFDGKPYQHGAFPFAQVIAAGKPVRNFLCVMDHPSGRKVFLSISGSPLFDEGEMWDGGILVVEDITAVEEARAKIIRLNRVYSVLSNTNQAIVRLRDRRQLFEEACRIAVSDGKFALAWIGTVNQESRTVDVAAKCGTVKGYLDHVQVKLAEGAEEEYLTSAAILQGHYLVSNDIAQDDRITSRKSQYLSYGFRSSAAFPLKVSGNTIGAFTLYAADANYFDDEEIKLLSELATDIAFGVETIEQGEQRQRAEEAFRQLEERFSKAFHANPIPIGIARLSDGRFIDVNEQLLAWTGFSREEILGHTAPELSLWPDPSQREKLLETLAERKSVRGMEIKLRPKSGELRDILAYFEIVELSDEPCMLGMLYDITERKRTEQEVLTSLTEKEMLLKEIHHRVKNNLQVISSLLNLQTDYVRDEHDLVLFRESQNRVKSMALIHEKLYHSATLSRIDFDMYMRDLTAQLFRTYNVRDVNLEIEVEPSSFGVDTAIPCGLIINELVSNALKYAFPAGRSGHVRVALHRTGEDQYILSVSDDGVGFPAGLDFRNTKSLGLQLVMTLTTQLGADITLTRDQGTTFTISFALRNLRLPSAKSDLWPKAL